MLEPRILLSAFISFLLIPGILHPDIVITHDEMILNGKIIEEKKEEYIKFCNYHGTFTIEYRHIREIHRTKSYGEDIKIYKEKGISVDESEVEANHRACLEMPAEQEKKPEDSDILPLNRFALIFSPFFNVNSGRLRSVLPYSYGGSVTGDVPVSLFYFRALRSEAGYFHSEKGVKRVYGFRASAGPLWEYNLSFGDLHFNYCISPSAGLGWYSIRGRMEEAAAIKWHAALSTGPVFNISSVLLSTQIRFEYIHDGAAPMYGIGLSAGAGFCL